MKIQLYFSFFLLVAGYFIASIYFGSLKWDAIGLLGSQINEISNLNCVCKAFSLFIGIVSCQDTDNSESEEAFESEFHVAYHNKADEKKAGTKILTLNEQEASTPMWRNSMLRINTRQYCCLLIGQWRSHDNFKPIPLLELKFNLRQKTALAANVRCNFSPCKASWDPSAKIHQNNSW